ncbi:unnamed protein product [Soboliphyme baturini]|uniref:N-terminal acetyltransferase B complex subunit MDM20 homolog n=1 Tax=Soboliphyme baturini TaxID=241478 RepID=A0A183IZI3_9BILA|nr:unnamed protein product [Soboliphyme baturini]
MGNNKRALSETEKLLKKQPDFLAAKALKTLSLIRLGRMDEAKRLLEEMTEKSPEEPFTLQALTYCYGDLGQPEKVITLYERVVKNQSKNEEYLSHLAMAYARVGDYRKLCLTAMHLYKLKPSKSFYYCWAVMCNIIQAYNDPELAQTMYLPLAEKMTRKYLAENTLLVEEGK